ncbi:MAG: hypothetical protein ABI877_04340 [Gemmatimonadaceae bacterium]
MLVDRYETIRRVVEHLCAQTIAEQIELVLVCAVREDFIVPDGAARALARVTIVQCPPLPMGTARAAGVRAATAPVIVVGETHAFPASDWAEYLVRAHEELWQSVAPGMENANPESARSWSGFLMDYGRWLGDLPAGEIAEPPAYNASWKREALINDADRKALVLEPGRPVDAARVAGRARFHHEPRAKVAHLNVAQPGAWSAERYWGGYLFGAHRSREWSLPRRLVYLGGSVLVPIIRFVRTLPSFALARSKRRLPRGTLVAIAGGSVIWGIGEAIGYIAGDGRAEARMLEYEMHKERYA